jgi:hypothetical protein
MEYIELASGSDKELEIAIEFLLSNGEVHEDFKKISEICAALVTYKNAIYGDKNLLKRGLSGINYRIEDKLARISNSDKSSSSKVIAAKEYFDIAGYCINAIRLLAEGKL